MRVKSKTPSISKEIVRDSIQGNYSCFSITAKTGSIEELSFNDILFIRNQLSAFIKHNSKKKGGQK